MRLADLLMDASFIALPSPGELWDFIQRIIEYLKIGGVALALLGSCVFLGTWCLSHLKRPNIQRRAPLWSTLAVWSSYVPVALTLVAAVASFVPALSPWVLKSFAMAVVAGGASWCISVSLLLHGGSAQDLARVRRAMILAGTPWYCLALWISRQLG